MAFGIDLEVIVPKVVFKAVSGGECERTERPRNNLRAHHNLGSSNAGTTTEVREKPEGVGS